MAQVSYLSIPAGMESAYKRILQPVDRFTFSRIRVKDIFLSRNRVKGITLHSTLVQLSPVWAVMSIGQKDAWTAAGEQSGLTGFKAFVYDTAARRRAGLDGYATPVTAYQAQVGRISIVSPSVGLIIEQAHPSTYYVLHKVTGTRSQYSPKAVSEPFSLPLEIAISYKTALTAAGSGARARFYALIYSNYQGRSIETPVEVDFALAANWTRSSATISAVLGSVAGYSCFIEVYNCHGDLYFDNVAITHSKENWARDPNCNNIAQSFTKAFYQVARHWIAVTPNSGADFGSVYYNP